MVGAQDRQCAATTAAGPSRLRAQTCSPGGPEGQPAVPLIPASYRARGLAAHRSCLVAVAGAVAHAFDSGPVRTSSGGGGRMWNGDP